MSVLSIWWTYLKSNQSLPSNFHLLWTPNDRPEQRKRPESGRSDKGQSTLSVKNLDALLGSNCVVFQLAK